jgi:hypothetical protein
VRGRREEGLEKAGHQKEKRLRVLPHLFVYHPSLLIVIFAKTHLVALSLSATRVNDEGLRGISVLSSLK